MHTHVLICLGRGARWFCVISDPVNIEFREFQLFLTVAMKIYEKEVLFGTNN